MKALIAFLIVFLFSVGRCGVDLSWGSSSISDLRCCGWSNRLGSMGFDSDRMLWRWGRPPEFGAARLTTKVEMTVAGRLLGYGCRYLDLGLTVGAEALPGAVFQGSWMAEAQQMMAAATGLDFGTASLLPVMETAVPVLGSCFDWVPISVFWVASIRSWAWGLGWLWAQNRAQYLGLRSPQIWIWDPGGVLGTCLLKCVRIISGVLCLRAGRMLIAIFYIRFQYNHAVSTTIACLASSVNCAGTNIVLSYLPISCMPELQSLMIRSPNLKVMTVVSLLVIILRRLGIYLQFSVSVSISDSEQYFIVYELPVGVVHLLVCSSLALAPSRLWLVSAPTIFRDAILNDCNR